MKISHIISISQILTDIRTIRQKIRIKNTFAVIFYNVLVAKKSRKNIKKLFEDNGKQSVNFKTYFKQLAVSFKIYIDFVSVLKRIRSVNTNNDALYTKI